MKEFKYKEHHELLKCSCPPLEKLAPTNIIAFRWIHTNLENKNNFLPPLLIEPARIDTFETCEIKCSNYALSFFNDQNKAERKLKSMLNRKPLLINSLGGAIAKIEIDEDDGMADTPRASGHFNFHEFFDADLKSKSTFVKELQIGK